jgi:hypothetical protein
LDIEEGAKSELGEMDFVFLHCHWVWYDRNRLGVATPTNFNFAGVGAVLCYRAVISVPKHEVNLDSTMQENGN